MEQIPYKDLSDLVLLELCVWREARGESHDGKRAVAHCIRNRVYSGVRWWGTDWQSVILHPWQFSSFNTDDPNSALWPTDTDLSFIDCGQACVPVFNGADDDLTQGATFYHDTSIGWPQAWGDQANYEQTLAVGRLLFYRSKPVNNREDVSTAVAEG
jgi:hypothetical protein